MWTGFGSTYILYAWLHLYSIFFYGILWLFHCWLLLWLKVSMWFIEARVIRFPPRELKAQIKSVAWGRDQSLVFDNSVAVGRSDTFFPETFVGMWVSILALSRLCGERPWMRCGSDVTSIAASIFLLWIWGMMQPIKMAMARQKQSQPGSKAQYLSPNQFLGWAGPLDINRQLRRTEMYSCTVQEARSPISSTGRLPSPGRC